MNGHGREDHHRGDRQLFGEVLVLINHEEHHEDEHGVGGDFTKGLNHSGSIRWD